LSVGVDCDVEVDIPILQFSELAPLTSNDEVHCIKYPDSDRLMCYVRLRPVN
jgi:hypothetical protein